MDHFFLSLYWICYNIASILCFLAMRHSGIILTNRSKDRTHMPCIGRWSLRHWTAREIPTLSVCKRLKSWCYVISFQQYVPSSPWLHVEIFQRGFKSNDGWGPHSGNLILLSRECGWASCTWKSPHVIQLFRQMRTSILGNKSFLNNHES